MDTDIIETDVIEVCSCGCGQATLSLAVPEECGCGCGQATLSLAVPEKCGCGCGCGSDQPSEPQPH